MPRIKGTRLERLDKFGLVCFLLIAAGLALPWLWRGYDSYQVRDSESGEISLQYRYITKISPFFMQVLGEEGNTKAYFYSPLTSLSGVVLLVSGFFFVFKDVGYRWKGLSCFAGLFSTFFFFMNLGGGLWLGLLTRFDVGFKLVILGLLLRPMILFYEYIT